MGDDPSIPRHPRHRRPARARLPLSAYLVQAHPAAADEGVGRRAAPAVVAEVVVVP